MPHTDPPPLASTQSNGRIGIGASAALIHSKKWACSGCMVPTTPHHRPYDAPPRHQRPARAPVAVGVTPSLLPAALATLRWRSRPDADCRDRGAHTTRVARPQRLMRQEGLCAQADVPWGRDGGSADAIIMGQEARACVRPSRPVHACGHRGPCMRAYGHQGPVRARPTRQPHGATPTWKLSYVALRLDDHSHWKLSYVALRLTGSARGRT